VRDKKLDKYMDIKSVPTGESLVKVLFDMGRDSGCTMILSTHDPNVSALANRIIEIRDGAIVKE